MHWNSRFNFVEMEIYHEHSRVLAFSFSKLVSGPFHSSTSRSAAFLKWGHRMSLYDCDFFFFFKPVPRGRAGTCSPVCWDRQGCDVMRLCPGCGLKRCSCSAKTSFPLQVRGCSGSTSHRGDVGTPDSPRFLGSDGAFLGLPSSYRSPSPRMPPSPPPSPHAEVRGNGQIWDPLPRTAPYHHP